MFTSLLSLSLILGAPTPKEEPKDKDKAVEGKWVVVSVQGPKKDLEGETIFEFTKDTITIHEPKRSEKPVTYKIDWTKKPAQIDITAGGAGGAPEKLIKGIIERKGDELKLAFTPEETRPEKFEGGGDKVLYVILKLKPEEKKPEEKKTEEKK